MSDRIRNTIGPYFFHKIICKKSTMKIKLMNLVSSFCVVAVMAGCASTSVTTSPEAAMYEQLPPPGRIWVYDFTQAYATNPLQAEIGREISSGLISNIRQMGLPAEPGSQAANMQINDIVLQGKILRADEGDAAKRIVLGFGSGASELRVQVEGYQVTPQGLRRIGGGTGDAGGSKTPGAALGAVGALASGSPAGLIVNAGMKVYGEASGSSKIEGRTQQIIDEISERLRMRFQQHGWIRY
jgi:hypothetical protein